MVYERAYDRGDIENEYFESVFAQVHREVRFGQSIGTELSIGSIQVLLVTGPSDRPCGD